MKILILEDRPMPNYQKVLEHLQIDYTNSTTYCKEYDGLLIPGGVDVNPLYYQQENLHCQLIEDELDQKQLSVISQFIAEKKPILGICRGHQIVNVALGGSLIQDISSAIIHPGSFDHDSYHTIRNAGFMRELYGSCCLVNSSHHQAVEKVAEGFEVVSTSDDGIIEAMQHKSLPILTVQFHPERMTLDFQKAELADGIQVFQYFFQHYF